MCNYAKMVYEIFLQSHDCSNELQQLYRLVNYWYLE